MADFDRIQELLNEQAERRSGIKQIPFDGRIEVKEVSGKNFAV